MGKNGYMITAAVLISLWGGIPALAGDELAIVNGEVITAEELDSRMMGLAPQMRMHYMSSEGKSEFLDQLITGEVLFQEGLRLGLDKDNGVQAKIEQAKRDILVNSTVNKIIGEKLGEPQIKKYYADHKKDFRQVKASHILVDQEDQAKAIYKELKGGADFAELAKKHSKDTSTKDNGGDLGYFARGQMVKPFEEAAFSLKVNKVSEPVQTSFGYHVIKVLDIKEPKKFEEITPEDLNIVKGQMLNEEIDRLKKTARIEVHKERIK